MKDFINWDALVRLAEIAGPVGLVVIGLGGLALYFVKSKNWSGFGDKTKMVAASRLDKIDERLGRIEDEVDDIKDDLEDRPTKDDFNVLKTEFKLQEQQMKTLGKQIEAVGSGVTRVEDFLISLSKGK